MTTTAPPPSPPTVTPVTGPVESLVLHGSRVPHVVWHMGLLLVFDEPVAATTLVAEARRLAANPLGLGRRLVLPRIPGARPFWQVDGEPPAVEIADGPFDPAQLASWLHEQASTPLDPERGPGWRIAAAPTPEGGTAVVVMAHHAYGTGRSILEAMYAPSSYDLDGPSPPLPRPSLTRELDDLGRRLRTGIGGVVDLGRRSAGGAATRLLRLPATALGGRSATPAPAPGAAVTRLLSTVGALGGGGLSGPGTSNRRVVAAATVAVTDWAEAAERHGGSANALLLAVAANLLRGSRSGDDAPDARPLRIAMPVDVTREVSGDDRVSPVQTVVTSEVLVANGVPDHDRIETVHQATSAAVRQARQAARDRPPGLRGTSGPMRLLPDALTFRLAYAAISRSDGSTTNVGELPAGALRLGDQQVSAAGTLGFPIGGDLTVSLTRHGEHATLVVIVDRGRLGPGPTLHERLAAELAGWGVEGRVR